MQKIEQPLVSIVVITYNSGKYVLETLESAKAQSYQNIELIITDDCSADNTIEICSKWLEENKERFVRAELIRVEKNTGIPSNCNRGLFAAQGAWIKFIAGDDALLENCILDNINRVNEIAEHVYALHSEVECYSLLFNEIRFIYTTDKSFDTFCNNLIRADDQLKLLVRGYGPHATTAFFHKKVLIELNGFNEALPYEDGPIWVKLSLNDLKIHYMNKTTVKYRIHDSISNSESRKLLFKPIYRMDNIVFEKVYRQHLKFYEIIARKTLFLIKDLFWILKLNKQNKLNYFLFNALNLPFILVVKISFITTNYAIKKRIKYGK